MDIRINDLIEKKKRGEALDKEEIDVMVRDYTAGVIPDYQMSAMLMAIWFQGMTDEETTDLTLAMADSGDRLDLSSVPGIKVDKHSTGGVGDKTTLVVAPVLAALGVPVAKMSGRGLGFTGGTVDKLESIPGVRSEFSEEEFLRVLGKVGFVDAAQTKELAPADKKLYALRDVTGTVDSIPLIASSIMSKKIASGADRIVLDVKCGSGAFMGTPDSAKELAEQMIRIGQLAGRKTTAVISDMNQPLGRMVGNTMEVEEAVEVLKGGGEERLRTLCTALAVEMLQLSDKCCEKEEEARAKIEAVLNDGSALGKFRDFVEAAGGDAGFLDAPVLPAKYKKDVYPEKEGYLSSCNTAQVGLAASRLGAGRSKKDDIIDPAAGICILAKLGDRVSLESPIAVLYTNKEETLPEAESLLREAYIISDEKPEEKPVVLEVIREGSGK